MSQDSYIPAPYFQFVTNAANFDFTKSVYEAVPNKKVHRHCPFIIIEADYINKPLMDVAVATLETGSSDLPATSEAKTNDLQTVDTALSSDDSELLENQQTLRNTESQSGLKPNAAKAEQTVNETSEESEALSEQEKQRLDYLAQQEANPINLHEYVQKTEEPANTEVSASDSTDINATDTNTDDSRSKDVLADQSSAILDSEELPTVQELSPSDYQTDSDTANEVAEVSLDDADTDTDTDKKKSRRHKKEKEEEPLTEEEQLKIKKEAQLESYKQFLAEQKNKVAIDYPGVRVDIEANALPSRMYFIMNALSAIIASYGLVVNSAAVVIGAMLVAMMLGPISGAALAIIDYRAPLLRKSLLTVLAGAAMVMLIGFIIGYIHQDSPLTNEILSRTQPTSMDLMIALAGGTAGAYAMISPQLSVAVVGVAVATALVPPLAASGILFAHGEGSLGLGALLLAVTNIIAIQFTNALVLWSSGFRRLVEDDYKSSPMVAFFRRNAVPLLLLAGIGVYLTYNFNTITKKQKFENEVKESVNDYFIDKGNALTNTQFVPREDYQTVRAVIRGETRPSSSDAQYLEQQINIRIKEEYPKYQPVRLQLRYIPVIVIESSPYHKDEIDKTDAAILANE